MPAKRSAEELSKIRTWCREDECPGLSITFIDCGRQCRVGVMTAAFVVSVASPLTSSSGRAAAALQTGVEGHNRRPRISLPHMRSHSVGRPWPFRAAGRIVRRQEVTVSQHKGIAVSSAEFTGDPDHYLQEAALGRTGSVLARPGTL